MEQARRQLQEREQQFGELMRILPDGVMLIADGRVIYANPACAAQFGYRADALAGESLAALVEDGGLPRLGALLDPRAAGTPAPAPRMRRGDGSLFNAALSACDARYAGQACKLLIVRDLSEPERMRDALALGNRELQALAGRLFSLQEEERRAISRELHDDIGQSITAVKLSASAALEEADPARRREDLTGIIELADATLDKLRDISTLLRPPQLDALGLEAALRGHALQLFRKGGVEVELRIEPLPRRPSREVEQACFRIAQEALTNVRRHSRARSAMVALCDRDDALSLEVRDDGNGFEQSSANGLGLVIMRERAQTVGGSLRIESSACAGTRICARLPYAPPPDCGEAADGDGR
ncbi:PAS domain S-box protein [Luteimonas sp. SJ-92]|uniref:Oxygen sensor histidine kinase NreB n=1 Tax=Luteimonas salinisoli TaxID=2752307 RepID=A0A853JF43_9GAMM|nr:PAS domain S-box protein [Luteimonas salinisoli]